MIGSKYISTGITIKPVDGRWEVSADFCDSGWCDEASTEGTMRVRYQVKDPVEAARVLKQDMEAMGIQFGISVGTGASSPLNTVDPSVYFPGDSENPEFIKHTEMIDKVCVALGWRNIYKREEAK